jgi:hypothetical protein
MATRKEREQFIALMVKEGLKYELACDLLRAARSLQTISERLCDSEYHCNVDIVPCPATRPRGKPDDCCCDMYQDQHEKVPRIAVRGERIEKRIAALCEKNGIKATFNGDPRGAVLVVSVPSGYSDSWGREGVCVPS